MTAKPKTTTKKKPSAATETSQSIEEQTAAFLKSGGEIEHINTGVSGQESLSGPSILRWAISLNFTRSDGHMCINIVILTYHTVI